MPLIIYTPVITNRMRYVFDHIFKHRWHIDYVLENNLQKFIGNSSSVKMIYADDAQQIDFLFLYASGLLQEADIKQQEISSGYLDDCLTLFTHSNTTSALRFDVFAAVFYLLSRYEEYVIKETDIYGNFDVQQSILYKLDVLHTPVVEQWLEVLKRLLQKHFPQLQFEEKKFSFIYSFDVDVAFAYKSKGLYRTAGSILKNIITLQFKTLAQQLQTLLAGKHDVYDTYDYIISQVKSEQAYFFFNMGSYGAYDKNPSAGNKAFRNVIKKLGNIFIIGLHPSYKSNNNQSLLQHEKFLLEKILQQKVAASRQHYLKLSMPSTYQNLVARGFIKDFTMGYYFNYGFRAGTCKPFLFYDLAKEETTTLQLYPFAYMDGTLNNVLKQTPAEAKEIITALVNTVKKYNGIFIPLWHNSTLSEVREWKNWRQVFEHNINILNQAAE